MEDVGVFYGHLLYLFYGHLIYFMAIWYILLQFVIFSPVFVYIVQRKIWQPWSQSKASPNLTEISFQTRP
jgi:hypothetical protein